MIHQPIVYGDIQEADNVEDTFVLPWEDEEEWPHVPLRDEPLLADKHGCGLPRLGGGTRRR